ncbi:hypothetical protein PR048_026192 [Dryococelus australis]|uniref:Uncharacterized protein n=1 Tax=Dryococelus australis TaxID=614101 RepID=A0ABQ9GKM2_9NEOP|nr:hypothetical protein PR048_026192 [Dryococelus australis]
MKGRVERERSPRKTRRPAASSGTITICENPGVTPPRIEPGSPRWEASSLTTTPLRSPPIHAPTLMLCDSRAEHLPRRRHRGANPRRSDYRSATLPLSYEGRANLTTTDTVKLLKRDTANIGQSEETNISSFRALVIHLHVLVEWPFAHVPIETSSVSLLDSEFEAVKTVKEKSTRSRNGLYTCPRKERRKGARFVVTHLLEFCEKTSSSSPLPLTHLHQQSEMPPDNDEARARVDGAVVTSNTTAQGRRFC